MRWAIMGVLVALCGCGPTVKFFPMNPSPNVGRPALTSNERPLIDVYSTPPDRPYVEIGIIKVRARSRIASSPERMMELLKQEAYEVGADAVIVAGVTNVPKMVWIDGEAYLVHKDVIQAMAIAWQ